MKSFKRLKIKDRGKPYRKWNSKNKSIELQGGVYEFVVVIVLQGITHLESTINKEFHYEKPVCKKNPRQTSVSFAS